MHDPANLYSDSQRSLIAMIDETTFFGRASGASDVALQWHKENLRDRLRPMTLLLTEVRNPETLAQEVLRSLGKEEAPLLRLRAEHEVMMEEWRTENPGVNPDSPCDGYSYTEIKQLFFTLPRPPFMRERRVIDEALGRIETERQNCHYRLAARLRDKESGGERSRIDEQEESDPLLRIYAMNLREQHDTHEDVLKLREIEREHLKRIRAIRMKKP